MAEITFKKSGPGSMNFQWLKPGEMYLSTKKSCMLQIELKC